MLGRWVRSTQVEVFCGSLTDIFQESPLGILQTPDHLWLASGPNVLISSQTTIAQGESLYEASGIVLESFREGNSCPLGGRHGHYYGFWDERTAWSGVGQKAVGQGMAAAGRRQGWTLGRGQILKQLNVTLGGWMLFVHGH